MVRAACRSVLFFLIAAAAAFGQPVPFNFTNIGDVQTFTVSSRFSDCGLVSTFTIANPAIASFSANGALIPPGGKAMADGSIAFLIKALALGNTTATLNTIGTGPVGQACLNETDTFNIAKGQARTFYQHSSRSSSPASSTIPSLLLPASCTSAISGPISISVDRCPSISAATTHP